MLLENVYLYVLFSVSTIIYLTSWCMAGSVRLLTGRVNFRTSPWCCSLCDNSYWHNEEQPTSQQVVLFKELSHCTQARGKKHHAKMCQNLMFCRMKNLFFSPLFSARDSALFLIVPCTNEQQSFLTWSHGGRKTEAD